MLYSSRRHNSIKKISRIAVALAAVTLLPVAASAQLNEALMLSTQPLPSGARGLAMGGNLISAEDGIAALDFNPAAIAPIPGRELTFSLFNREHNSTSAFFASPSQSSMSNFAFSSIGIAVPLETTRGHFAFGVSYDRTRDYTSSYSFTALNPISSHFNATQKDVEESGDVTQEGGLSAFRVGAGIDIAEGVSAGATLNILAGQYDYSQHYTENDRGVDTGLLFYIKHGDITNVLHQEQSGGSLKLGLQVDRKIVKFGLTIETPQVIHINETSSVSGVKQYSDSTFVLNDEDYAFAQEYDIVTPMRIGGGLSTHVAGITASANVSYTDMTQLRFRNITSDMEHLNEEARTQLRSVLSWQFGAEYIIPFTGISIRGGYSVEPSPYKDDPKTYDTKAISGGLGILLSPSILLEGSLRHMTYHTNHAVFEANIDDDAVKRDDVSLTFKYRF